MDNTSVEKKIDILFTDILTSQILMCDDQENIEYDISVTSESISQSKLLIWITGASKKVTVNVVMNTVHTYITIDICIRAQKDSKHIVRVNQHHTVPDTQSDCPIKGIAYDSSIIDYEGLITLEPGSHNAQANQKSTFLIMSESATVRSVPSLEVHHNNVACGHSTIVSYLDPVVLWYGAQRGLKEEKMEILIENVFFKDNPL